MTIRPALIYLTCFALTSSASLFGQTIVNNSGSLTAPTIITFDTVATATVSNLSTLGLGISSLDPLAGPFISNVGGVGLGSLPNNALGNNRVGQFSYLGDAPDYDLGTVRNFQFTISNRASAFGFSVYGWGGTNVNHSVGYYDALNVLIASYTFSQLGLTANDNGANGFFAVISSTPIASVIFQSSLTGKDFLAIDDVTYSPVPEPAATSLAVLGLAAWFTLRGNRRR